MRTTVTLDADVESLIRAAMQRGRRSFKQTANDALRRGLEGDDGVSPPPFVVAARPMGLRPGLDPARLQDVDDELEVDDFLRKTRALAARGK